MLPKRPDGREQSSLNWEYEFAVPLPKEGEEGVREGTVFRVKWCDFVPTYRGKPKEGLSRCIAANNIKRVTLMMRRLPFPCTPSRRTFLANMLQFLRHATRRLRNRNQKHRRLQRRRRTSRTPCPGASRRPRHDREIAPTTTRRTTRRTSAAIPRTNRRRHDIKNEQGSGRAEATEETRTAEESDTEAFVVLLWGLTQSLFA